jgi:hypothetical protein
MSAVIEVGDEEAVVSRPRWLYLACDDVASEVCANFDVHENAMCIHVVNSDHAIHVRHAVHVAHLIL